MSNKMESVDPIVIPQSHIDFANSVADLADKFGMKEFTMEYDPSWSDIETKWDNRVRGKAIIRFSAKDGRGRPCRCVDISFDAHFKHVIEYHEPSFN